MSKLLSLLMLLPMFGAIAILFTPRQWTRGIRRFSVGIMLLEAVLSLALFQGDFTTSAFQFVEQAEWIPQMGIRYSLGVDGISLWLVLLTTWLTPVALYVSYNSVSTKLKEFAFSFLLLEVGMIGAFVSLDLFLFYIFWELMLVPMYFIVGIWGGKDRIYAALKFFIYTMVGSLLMLVAILYLASEYHAAWMALPEAQQALLPAYSFGYQDLLRLQLPQSTQVWLFAAFALAFAIKVPMFPLHTWLPDAHVQAPTGGSVILAAVLLKLGGYGFLRFVMPFFAGAWHFGVDNKSLGSVIAILSVAGIVYGAVCAWVQRDVKKLVAYSSVSHLGFVMLGIASATVGGMQGAILQMVSHGISTGALFILVGVIYDRRHTRELADFGGLAKSMPLYTVFFVIVTMSSVGLPGTNGFVGEFMVLSGTFLSADLGGFEKVFAAIASTGVILAAVYMLHAVLRMFWGPITHEENRGLADLNRRELTVLVPLMLSIFWIGLFPAKILDSMKPSVESLVAHYNSSWVATKTEDRRVLKTDGLVAPEAPTPPTQNGATDNGAVAQLQGDAQ